MGNGEFGRGRIRRAASAGCAYEADDDPVLSRDSKWIYFASNRSGRDEIYRVASGGGEAVRVTDNGGYVAFESIDGQSLYYTKTTGSLRYSCDCCGRPRASGHHFVCFRGFVVSERGIYYISNPGHTDIAVQLLDPTTGKSTVLWKNDRRLYQYQGLGSHRTGKTILISAATNAGADLMLVERFR